MKWLYWLIVLVIAGTLFNAGTVGTVFGWIVLVIAAGLHALLAFSPPVESSPRTQAGAPDRSAAGRTASRSKPSHEPPGPKGVPTAPWSTDTSSFEVAGENFRELEMSRVFRGTPIRSENGAELNHPANLVPDPGNPYDPNAVAIFVVGHHVGYLERSDAQRYHRAVAQRYALGELITVQSRQWARTDGHRVYGRVTLRLPDPSGFAPASDLPPNALVLPPGGAVQVTREDEHMDALIPLLDRTGAPKWLAASLSFVEEQRARSVVNCVEVQLPAVA